jgi:hypothetical protein
MKKEMINGKDRVEHVQIDVSMNAIFIRGFSIFSDLRLTSHGNQPLPASLVWPVIWGHLIVRTSKRAGVSTIRIIESRDAEEMLATDHVSGAKYR